MWILDRIAEQRIEQARDAGAFDKLPGMGQPLPEEDLSLVPEELRVAYRVLKNAGYIPPELELHKEAVAVALQLATQDEVPPAAGEGAASARKGLLARLARLNLLLAESGRPQLVVPPDYFQRLADKD